MDGARVPLVAIRSASVQSKWIECDTLLLRGVLPRTFFTKAA
jgi:hypothetical protein